MPEPKSETQASEVPIKQTSGKDVSTEGSDNLQESTEEIMDNVDTTDSVDNTETEGEEQPESSDAGEESSTSDTKKDGDKELNIDEFLKKDLSKDNVQKRIDSLVAQLKAAKEELATVKNKQPENTETEYTESQLRDAMKQAIQDGDSALVMDIIEYKQKRFEKQLVKRYEETEKSKTEVNHKIQRDWENVKNDYSKAWTDDVGKELYPNAKNELNLNNETSLLYRVALALYGSQDEEGNYKYHVEGGQRLAVADALTSILRKRKVNPQEGKVKKLERRLAKEKSKKSLGGGGSLEDDGRNKLTTNETLSDYVNERRKFRSERIGI